MPSREHTAAEMVALMDELWKVYLKDEAHAAVMEVVEERLPRMVQQFIAIQTRAEIDRWVTETVQEVLAEEFTVTVKVDAINEGDN